jgi:hypothetical protein
MTLRTSLFWTALSAASSVTAAGAQMASPAAGVSVSDTSIFAPLQLPPAPSSIRLANGAPGPKYWQNRADYDLSATLDTTTGTVQGTMVLRYTNHSPNTLDVLWIQTEQNTFRAHPPGTAGDFGDIIDRFAEVVNGTPTPVQLEDHETETKVTLPAPLKPGSTTTFQVAWHFIVPVTENRMGRHGSLYQIAQWYPRLNVYDDVKGWNTEPYLGSGEFFLEYGDFTLNVTVPANYILAATGTLDNPKEVLTSTEIARLARAATADTVVHVITDAELKSGAAHLKSDGMVTWKLHAKNVRDVSWAVSPDFQWDATHWKGVLAQAFYPVTASVSWDEAADMVRTSLQEYSEHWFPYPYPQASVVQGPITGMEYPMISWIPFFPKKPRLYYSITHEVGHNWFPMIVGSNERVHAWMDEGINQFINTFSESRRYPEIGDQATRAGQYISGMEQAIAQNSDAKIETPADSADGSYGYIAYSKPAGVLQLLRRDVMGPEVFDKGVQLYVRRWAYKHPTPEDFFRTMNDVAGRRLDWFWREWFLETPGFDQAVDSVSQTTQGNDTRVTVVYGNHGRGVLPILARFTFSDGTVQDFTYPAESWKTNSVRYAMQYTFSKKTVTRIELDPNHHLIDTNRANNVWAQ